jgi:hypothetical protein
MFKGTGLAAAELNTTQAVSEIVVNSCSLMEVTKISLKRVTRMVGQIAKPRLQ